MAHRLIVQIILTGSQIVGRAFVDAYRQAAANAARANAGGAGNAAARSSADALTRQTGLALDEARQILNVEKNAELEEIIKKYEHLFAVNDKAKGGSFYLQSKVVRARERIEMEFERVRRESGASESASASSSQQQQPPPSA
ncbi:mitochondrial import inner membrane translocase subunit TIM16 [Ramicandelaber brevisporus]|nr:mitochondrial import inner membrane translocase subunit TIM16 [Ramicandelaber brevisporus]